MLAYPRYHNVSFSVSTKTTPKIHKIAYRKFSSKEEVDPYSILGIAANATQQEIKKAWVKKAKEYHPDTKTDPQSKKDAEKMFIKINEAYQLISNELSRRDYDLGRRKYEPSDHHSKMEEFYESLQDLEEQIRRMEEEQNAFRTRKSKPNESFQYISQFLMMDHRIPSRREILRSIFDELFKDTAWDGKLLTMPTSFKLTKSKILDNNMSIEQLLEKAGTKIPLLYFSQKLVDSQEAAWATVYMISPSYLELQNKNGETIAKAFLEHIEPSSSEISYEKRIIVQQSDGKVLGTCVTSYSGTGIFGWLYWKILKDTRFYIKSRTIEVANQKVSDSSYSIFYIQSAFSDSNQSIDTFDDASILTYSYIYHMWSVDASNSEISPLLIFTAAFDTVEKRKALQIILSGIKNALRVIYEKYLKFNKGD